MMKAGAAESAPLLQLVADPKLLFLDEPTSGLDSVSATKLSKILRQTAEDHNAQSSA